MKQLVLSFTFAVLAIAAVAQPSIVFNEFAVQPSTGGASSQADTLELLVLQDNLDMRGMIIKEHSSSGTQDAGGRLVFSSTANFLSSVPAGTLITIINNSNSSTTAGVSADTDPSDFVMSFRVDDSDVFNYTTGAVAGAFFPGVSDIFVILASGTSLDVSGTGYPGLIHALIVGNNNNTLRNGSIYLRFGQMTNPDTLSSVRIPDGGRGVISATNPNGTGTIAAATADYRSALTTLTPYAGTTPRVSTLGAGNNANNTAFIEALKLLTSNDSPFARNRNTLEVTAYPNPIAIGNTSKVTFNLPAADEVSLELVDATGKAVRELQPYTRMAAGEHTVAFTPTSADPLGLHFVVVKARTSGAVGYRKMLLLNW